MTDTAHMSLAERIHYSRTGTRIAPADPECRECHGTGHVTDEGYRGHTYERTSVTGWCRCVQNATRAAMAAKHRSLA